MGNGMYQVLDFPNTSAAKDSQDGPALSSLEAWKVAAGSVFRQEPDLLIYKLFSDTDEEYKIYNIYLNWGWNTFHDREMFRVRSLLHHTNLVRVEDP